MSPSSRHDSRSADAAPPGTPALVGALAVVAASVAAAGIVGWGLAVSVARLLGVAGATGPLGGIVGAVLALLLAPVLLWLRVPAGWTRAGRERRAVVSALTRPAKPADAGSPAKAPARRPDLTLVPSATAQPAAAPSSDFEPFDAPAAPSRETRPGALTGGHATERPAVERPAVDGPAFAAATAASLALGRAAREGATASGNAAVAAAQTLAERAAAAAAAIEVHAPVRDPLTGAYSQQHFIAAADREWSRVRRLGEDAALLMVDVDHFAQLNEQHGSTCGDLVLIEVTRQVSATLRQYDLLSRFSGGVLMVYLPHTDPLGALDVAERIRERVAAWRMQHDGVPVRVTVSVGVAAIGTSHARLDEAIADVGAALREAKEAGRNCVRAAPIPPRYQRPRVPSRD